MTAFFTAVPVVVVWFGCGVKFYPTTTSKTDFSFRRYLFFHAVTNTG
jgi:hypothetical protein